jgi:hypothetical protein
VAQAALLGPTSKANCDIGGSNSASSEVASVRRRIRSNPTIYSDADQLDILLQDGVDELAQGDAARPGTRGEKGKYLGVEMQRRHRYRIPPVEPAAVGAERSYSSFMASAPRDIDASWITFVSAQVCNNYKTISNDDLSRAASW